MLTVTEGTSTELTVMVIPALTPVLVTAHEELDVISQVTTLPLARAFVLKVGLFVPAFMLFIFH
jgi:hypothetical protein